MKEPRANAIVFHREGNGQAEIHEKLADFLIVRAGEGAVIVGGKAVSAKTPVAVPHQALVENGKFMNAMVIKMETK